MTVDTTVIQREKTRAKNQKWDSSMSVCRAFWRVLSLAGRAAWRAVAFGLPPGFAPSYVSRVDSLVGPISNAPLSPLPVNPGERILRQNAIASSRSFFGNRRLMLTSSASMRRAEPSVPSLRVNFSSCMRPETTTRSPF